MSETGFAEFEAASRALGYNEVLQRDWPPGTTQASHSHAFAVKAIVVSGEMWLQTPEGTQHLRPGEGFELAASVPHAERYGDQGTRVWVARRHAAP